MRHADTLPQRPRSHTVSKLPVRRKRPVAPPRRRPYTVNFDGIFRRPRRQPATAAEHLLGDTQALAHLGVSQRQKDTTRRRDKVASAQLEELGVPKDTFVGCENTERRPREAFLQKHGRQGVSEQQLDRTSEATTS